MSINTVTITGGLPRDAELRYTAQGQAVASFTIAESDSRYNDQTNSWDDVRKMYIPVTIWDESADRKQKPKAWAQAAAQLKQGDQVAVTGKLHTRQWEDKQGNKRSQLEMLAYSFYVQPALQSPAQGNQPQQSGQWSQQPPAQQQPAQGNAWGTTPQDNPPF